MKYKMPNLVLVTGVPASGKSEVAKFLASRFGYVRIDSDEVTREQLGHTWPYQPGEDTSGLWDITAQRRDDALRGGYDVVMDMTTPDNTYREYILWSPVSARKYIVHVKASREELRRRRQERADRGQYGWNKDDLFRWEREFIWADPKQSQRYALLACENNTPEDLERIKEDLRRYFTDREKE